MNYKEKIVSLSNIDVKDISYRITTETHIEELAHSIQHIGLINLPILIKKESEYIIISGFRRIAACQCFDYPDIGVRILEPETTPLECIKIAIADNAFQRPLNLIEISRSLTKLSDLLKEPDKLAKEALTLGLPENPSFINKIIAISSLPWAVQQGILHDTISLAIVSEMERLEPESQIAVAALFDSLKLSLNKQREVMTLVEEIAIRGDISIPEVLQAKDIQEILSEQEMDRNQKSARIRSILKHRRFPLITNTEQAFEQVINDLNPAAGIKLLAPQNFEGSLYTINFSFRNLIELKERQSGLDKLIQNPILNKLFSFSVLIFVSAVF